MHNSWRHLATLAKDTLATEQTRCAQDGCTAQCDQLTTDEFQCYSKFQVLTEMSVAHILTEGDVISKISSLHYKQLVVCRSPGRLLTDVTKRMLLAASEARSYCYLEILSATSCSACIL